MITVLIFLFVTFVNHLKDQLIKIKLFLLLTMQRWNGTNLNLNNVEILAITSEDYKDITENVLIYKQDYIDDGEIYNFIIRANGIIKTVPYSAENGSLLSQIENSL